MHTLPRGSADGVGSEPGRRIGEGNANLVNCVPAIDHPACSLHETRFLATQKHTDIGNLVCLAHPMHRGDVDGVLHTQRDRFDIAYSLAGAQTSSARLTWRDRWPGPRSLCHGRIDDAGTNGIHPYPPRRDINRVTSRQTQHRGFSSAVYRRVRSPDNPQLTRDIDDRSPLGPNVRGDVLRLHHRDLLSCAQPESAIIDAADSIKVLD